jgi:predicted enzyme related to lactoylglutathione lyase
MSRVEPKQISVASLWTEDVPTTVRFYSEVIGLRLCPCQPRHMDPPHFDVSGAYLAILKGKSVLSQNAETFPVIALAFDDLDSAIERLKAHQVALLKDVQEDLDSRWVFFHDPGGNLIELVHWK